MDAAGLAATGAGQGEPLVVDVLYIDGCPNHESFLPHLRELLGSRGVSARVRLVHVGSDEDAQRLRFLGSPSVRIDGRDVEPGADGREGYGLQCRLYRTSRGVSGTPDDAWILAALSP
ncbi:DF family (seleno)protein [Kineococcus xinjiangensis]|nr:hypothetical protein [Kineococcus xinjiangensis]